MAEATAPYAARVRNRLLSFVEEARAENPETVCKAFLEFADLEESLGHSTSLESEFNQTRDPLLLFAFSLQQDVRLFRKCLVEQRAIDIIHLIHFLSSVADVTSSALAKPHERWSFCLRNLVGDFLAADESAHFPVCARKQEVSLEGFGHLPLGVSGSGETFILSTGFLRDRILYFDFFEGIIDRLVVLYKERADSLESRFGTMTHLCFVHKDVGPSGPIRFLDRFRSAFPYAQATFYRQGPLASGEASRLSGNHLKDDSHVCVLYDQDVTRSAAVRFTTDISTQSGSRRISTLVTHIHGINKRQGIVGEIAAAFADSAASQLDRMLMESKVINIMSHNSDVADCSGGSRAGDPLDDQDMSLPAEAVIALREYRAFLSQRQELLRKYRNQYVAMKDCVVVASGQSEMALALKMHEAFPDEGYFMERVDGKTFNYVAKTLERLKPYEHDLV